MVAAAFFDLDRTLLPCASGTFFARHLEAEGISSNATKAPGAELMVRAYDLFGETRLNVAIAKLAVRASAGWSVEAVERAARNAVRIYSTPSRATRSSSSMSIEPRA